MAFIVDPGHGMSAAGISMASKLAEFGVRLGGRAPFNSAGFNGMAAVPAAHSGQDQGPNNDPAPASPEYPLHAPVTPSGQQLTIEAEDWDMMFDAVRSRLLRTVGQRLGELPKVPAHSAALSASLVQAVVLDCVTEMDKLHAALKRERRQRLTP